MGFGGIGIWSLLIIIFGVIIPLLIFGPIAKKAGYSRWWALIMLVPVVNLIMIWVFSFAKWPVENA
jgi:hypothetical protein